MVNMDLTAGLRFLEHEKIEEIKHNNLNNAED